MISSILSRLFCLFLRVSGPNSFPEPLSKDEQTALFIKARDGDKLAREKLIEHNLRLVAHIVKKYYSGAKNQEDLVSIGTVGLIKAIDSFDIRKGAKFTTYASKCLQNEILMYFRSQKKSSCEVSLSETIDTDKDGNPLTYSDIIYCDDTIAEDIDVKLNSGKAISIIRSVLCPREREIIVLRFGLHNEKPITQREIAEKLGISRSYVSRIEKSAIEKIRAEFERTGQTFFGS
ncbi:MAG: RNA polymerase sporulation sigma factor SigK [Clostridia bacterium]|nr:RNA polymerase sporulation sigma factor SigK [Clostridia bacterium]